MPVKPARVCNCGHRVADGARCSCDLKRKAEADKARPNARARGYDGDWEALRRRFLQAHPRCEICDAQAREVDHIQSVAERPDLRLSWPNLRALCKPCHSRRTVRDQGFARSATPAASTGSERETSRILTDMRATRR